MSVSLKESLEEEVLGLDLVSIVDDSCQITLHKGLFRTLVDVMLINIVVFMVTIVVSQKI